MPREGEKMKQEMEQAKFKWQSKRIMKVEGMQIDLCPILRKLEMVWA